MNEEEQQGFAGQVAAVFRLAAIESDSSIRLSGRSFALPPSRDPPSALIDFLQLLLYENIFCRAAAADFRFPGENQPPPADPEFRRRLLAAAPGAGGSGAVRVSLGDQPGFCYWHGSPRDGEWYAGSLLRLYFDLPPAAAQLAAARLPSRLSRFRIPFHFKILLQPAELERRCDGVVLFVQQRHFPVAGLLCLELLESLPAGGRSPLFTRRLAPGLGLAEDPGGSFGMSRCRLLAESLWHCHRTGITDAEEQAAEARRVFTARGLDPERPFLNPGSAGFYPLPSLAESSARIKTNAPNSSPRRRPGSKCVESEPVPGVATLRLPPSRERRVGGNWSQAADFRSKVAGVRDLGPFFLEAAFEIGARLCRDALWHENRCTWAGPASAPVDGVWRTIPRVWGPDLYAGTAGNALFLTWLHRATEEKILRATAEGAARHAVSLAGGEGGFYTGRAGIVYACLELGAKFGHQGWVDAGLDLLRSLPAGGEDPVFDLVGGAAGEVAALLIAWRRHGGDDLLEAAMLRGESMVARARPHLTGLSHGAAGIAWALLELFVATGEDRFRRAALEGFRYERSCYDPRRENWPDFRDPAGPAYPLHWCHGAPGIGLSRLRAWQILGDPSLRAEAEAALRATWGDLASPRPDAENFSLCHGLAGNAELLIEASRVFAQPAYFAAAAQIGRHGVELQRRNGGRIGSGLRGGAETPNLMLGSAGTGYFYLRLFDPENTPSILLPRQDG